MGGVPRVLQYNKTHTNLSLVYIHNRNKSSLKCSYICRRKKLYFMCEKKLMQMRSWSCYTPKPLILDVT